MTLWVSLETSSRAPSVALNCEAGQLQRQLAADRAHAADLLPLLAAMLLEVNHEPTDIDGIVVGTGPGSYTGLRVGIATALGLARGSGAALVAVPSMEALAYGELTPGEEGTLVADAHAGALYLARYERTANGLRTLVAPSVSPPQDVLAGVDWSRGQIFADTKSTALLELEAKADGRLHLDIKPRADALLELGTRRFEENGASAPEDIQPLYLRPFASKPRKR
ncbi:MAG: tRNA threonylcarbamoyladenosine biosynthesis protein TsaB [Chlamydiales bacterium]|jgi:tRNA threonylcarbamoyladenosine biosynthesis protein TsaB